MKTFTDTTGRSWQIELNIGSIKRLRDRLEVDLLQLDQGDPPLLTRLALDVVLLCDVVFVCVESQAEKLSVTDVEFGESLGGDVIVQAREAFFAELVDFFRRMGRRELARVIEKQEALIAQAMPLIEKRVEDLNLDELMAKATSVPTSGG